MALCSTRCKSLMRLDGKTAVITGCNTGIGKQTAKDFYERGAKVIMACRNIAKAESAKADIGKSAANDGLNMGELIVKKVDLNSLKSVIEFAEEIRESESQIHILVNNAGVATCPRSKTEDGFETQFGTNHLAHFLLTLLLLPTIIKSIPARIITVSSTAHLYGKIDFDDINWHRKKYKAFSAYSQSKLANVLFSKGLSMKLKANGIDGVTCYSLHPGAVDTELIRYTNLILFTGSHFLLSQLGKWFFKTPKQGAQTTIYCAVDEQCANETGLYYKDCAVAEPNPYVQNEEIIEKLWKVSLDMVNFDDKHLFK